MLILPAAPAAAISGKQDDTIVFFRWRGNQAARSYAIPANPKTTNQQAVRSALSDLSKEWATLSDAERESWTTFASANLTRDRLGREVQPTGLNWFIKANSNLAYQGTAAVATAPTTNAPAPLNATLSAVTAPNGIELTIPGTPTAGFQIKAMIEVLPSVAWTPSLARARMVAGVGSGSFKTVSATLDQQVTFTSDITFAAGQLVAVWAFTVRTADGTESIPVLSTMIATV